MNIDNWDLYIKTQILITFNILFWHKFVSLYVFSDRLSWTSFTLECRNGMFGELQISLILFFFFFQMLYNDLGRYSDLHQMAWAPPELGLWNRKQYICQTQPQWAKSFNFNKSIFDEKKKLIENPHENFFREYHLPLLWVLGKKIPQPQTMNLLMCSLVWVCIF